MRNYVQPGDSLELTAPAGGVTSGVPKVIGDLFVVPSISAAAGSRFIGKTDGVFELPKVSAQAWTEGAAIYFNPGTGLCSTAGAGGGRLIGVAAVAAANPSSLGWVRLNAVSLPAAVA